MGKQYIDGILEETIINQMIKKDLSETELAKRKILRLDERIASLNRQLNSDEWRADTRRNLKVWLNMFKEQRKELNRILNNKNKIRWN